MPLNIKLNDHPWMLTNCSLSITSYLNLGGEKLHGETVQTNVHIAY